VLDIPYPLDYQRVLERVIRCRLDVMESQGRIAEQAELKAALARLRSPDYGICALCRDPIPYWQLAVNPGARQCAGCDQ
jgi:RNA polymerase-binding transcription factor DksA